MRTIADLMKLPAVNAFKYGHVAAISNPDPTLLYGVELEIENTDSDMAIEGMRAVEDGSLRNNGWEFVTSPMTLDNLNYCLTTFFEGRGFREDNYSERTSVHVHTNCLDLTLEQMTSICLLYQVFEGVLFNFIGNNRDKNIFCVPWSETNISYRTVARLEEGSTDPFYTWQKYTALNLIPVGTQGTIEWRHMAGTHNYKTIILWCQLIGSIYAYARKSQPAEIKEMLVNLNNTSAYARVLDSVFGEFAHILRIPGYEVLLENGVLNMKYSLAEKKPPSQKYSPYNIQPGEFRWGEANQELMAQVRAYAADRIQPRPVPAPARARGQRIDTIAVDDMQRREEL